MDKDKIEREKVFRRALGLEREEKKEPKMTEEEVRSGKDLRQKQFDEAYWGGKKKSTEKEPTLEEKGREDYFMGAYFRGSKKPTERELTPDPKLKEAEKKTAEFEKTMKENIKGVRAELREIEQKLKADDLKSSDFNELDRRVSAMSKTLCLREDQTSGLTESNLLEAVRVYERWERGEIHVPEMTSEFKCENQYLISQTVSVEVEVFLKSKKLPAIPSKI